ncbi:MAG: 50S ribosomal protein L5 [Phycisphaerae bacterium]|nr:50S ribosomal protein L5 [Phycisphaerae bacterium]MCZ2401342.1 50S ribosomal protein L5 [Phycisphaerae bacterium]NUQ48710.1 50S ribosomal protein L5 [Phycisphaerae bacterium]
MARMLDRYREQILPAMMKELERSNPLSIPKLSKIVVSVGLGKAVAESSGKVRENKRFTEAEEHLATITGQKPVVCKARKSVSNFKLRAGWDVGLKVTLRGERMYEFLDRLITLAVPRVRDFRGLDPGSFDGRGNYGMGLSEYGVFPEINPDRVTYQQGMNITICTTARNDAEARQLLTHLGMPFRN